MGRHANPSPRHFWASFAAAFLRAAGGLALVAAAFALVSSIDRPVGDDDGGPAMLGVPDGDTVVFDPAEDMGAAGAPGRALTFAPPADSPPAMVPADRRDQPAAADAPASLDGPPADDPGGDVVAAAPPPGDTTVQVLGPAGITALDEVAVALTDLGYAVVATNPASAAVQTTTVLYSAGHEEAARALAAREPRIGVVAPNTAFSEDVDLHVVVADDWRP